MKVTILSDGAWGTALAMNLAWNGCDVTMRGPFPAYLEEMAKTHTNPKFLPGVTLPPSIHFEPDMKKAVTGREILVLATPTQYLRRVMTDLAPHLDPKKQLLLNVAKGIEVGTWNRIGEIVEQMFGKIHYAVLSGPSHAEEVSRRVPTAVVAASRVEEDALLVQKIFANENFRLYTSNDVVGVELGGALKNVMAIAAGVIDGMKLGDNPKAAMMTRGIYEMSKLGAKLGGKAQTFSGLSGIGDLIVTCTSGHSRNRHVGEELGRGKTLSAIQKEMGMVVAEGVPTAKGAYTLARQVKVETPIIDEIYAILYEKRQVPVAIRELMTRSQKPE